MTNMCLLLMDRISAFSPRRCRLLCGRSSCWAAQSRAERGFVGKGARSVRCRQDFGGGVSLLEDAVQGLYIAGALCRQLIGHRALRVCGKGSSPLSDVLGFAFQVLVQHVAAEG